MTALFVEQLLNGIQFGLILFLLAAGLTLIFGIMDVINLAHGSLYMIGAYLTATFTQQTGGFFLALTLAMVCTAIIGMLLEISILRHLYHRDHLSQVLATFGLILIANEMVRLIWGAQPLQLNVPEIFGEPIPIMEGLRYSSYRLFLIIAGLIVAGLLFLLVNRTKAGMWVRAGASNREMAAMMGVPIQWLFTAIFGIGAALCALAGGLMGPIFSVQIGMGESILILSFVVIVIGGIGSIRGAFLGALIVGIVDTAGRTLLPLYMRQWFVEPGILTREAVSALAPGIASVMIYLLMAVILLWKPRGLFPVQS
jgi:branched-chain amino acid transport system permease protein